MMNGLNKPPTPKCTKETSSTPMDMEPPSAPQEAAAATPANVAPQSYAAAASANPPTGVSPMEVDQPAGLPTQCCATPPCCNHSQAKVLPTETSQHTTPLAQTENFHFPYSRCHSHPTSNKPACTHYFPSQLIPGSSSHCWRWCYCCTHIQTYH